MKTERQWFIKSFTNEEKRYLVHATFTCDCPAYKFRGAKDGSPCKHLEEILKYIEKHHLIIAKLSSPSFSLEDLLKEKPSLIAFDVNGSLEIAGGKISLKTVKAFKERGWRVGIISNRVTGKFAEKLRSLGLDFYEKGELGKKDKVMSKLSKKYCGLTAWYVGNSRKDREDCEEAGWKFISV